MGMSGNAIDRQIQLGHLHRLHAGVYAVGHPVQTWEGRWMAAVLAGGRDAALSHRSAASLWRLLPVSQGPVDVAIPRSARSCGLVRRHAVRLLPDETTMRNRISTTTPSRTLFDLATVLRPDALERALREAEVLRLPLRPPLAEMLARHPSGRGARPLRTCLIRLGLYSAGITRTTLEDRFLAFLSRTDLPAPETNAVLEVAGRKIEADCVWREQRLMAELDGHGVHGTRAAFESDRERDRCLQAAGWRVVRVTWRQLDDARGLLARDLRALLCT